MDLVQNEESKPAVNGQQKHGNDDQRFRHMVGKTDPRLAEPHEIQAAIAERRDRMDDPHLKRTQKPVMRPKAQCQEQRADPLHDQAVHNDPAFKAGDPAGISKAQPLRHRHPLPHTDTFMGQQDKENHRGHKTEPADLDQDQEHDLAEGPPLRPHVAEGKTGYAGRGGSCKKCRIKTGRAMITGSDRKI